MNQGKVIYTGKTKQGKDILVSYPKSSDAKSLLDYINTLSREKTFIRFQGETISLEDEIKYLEDQLDKISKGRAIQLLAFCGEELISVIDFRMQDKTERHIGMLGISVAKNFRGEGIGSLMLELVLNEAVTNFPSLEIVCLQVFSNNTIAIGMYEKFGFIEYGKLPRGIKLEGGYDDMIYMYKNVRK
jgi:RimJ/RimL family protein N-acetyltransferase